MISDHLSVVEALFPDGSSDIEKAPACNYKPRPITFSNQMPPRPCAVTAGCRLPALYCRNSNVPQSSRACKAVLSISLPISLAASIQVRCSQ